MARDLELRFAPWTPESRVRFAPGGLARLGDFVRARSHARRILLIADRRVARFHGADALRALRRSGFTVRVHAVPSGERHKSAAELERGWEACARAGIGRRDAIVALGGGVAGDLAGFVAATWLRGVDWIGVPTSLLAQVDSSVGGKTAIDLPAGKNLAGAFHQPTGVLVDVHLLRTLAPRQFRAGLAEVVKLGLAVDGSLFRWLEQHARSLVDRNPDSVAEAVARAVRSKARIVRGDEREREGGARTALNFGHTAAHAFENARGYRGLLHGEAVAVGMRVALMLSVRAAGLEQAGRERAEALLAALGLPGRVRDTRLADVLVAMRRDKKAGARGEQRWVLTPRIGAASVPRVVEARFVRAALIAVGVRA